jgi:hypothetical protein
MGDILLVIQRLDGAGDVTTHAVLLVPKRALFVEKV